MIIFFTVIWLVTIPAFIIYWWKKRKARIAAGENYRDNEIYQEISRKKRIIGGICTLSFLSVLILLPNAILEEKARWAEELKAERLRENKEIERAEIISKLEGKSDKAKIIFWKRWCTLNQP